MEALRCIVCKKELKNVFEGTTNQPDEGLFFVSHGNYGSRVFDPMDGTFLEINVCDDCLVEAGEAGLVYSGRSRRPVVVDTRYGPLVVGWERLERPLVEWKKDVPAYGDSVTIDPEEVGTYPNVDWTITKEEVFRLLEREGGADGS